MSIQQNKDIVCRLYEAINQGQAAEVADQLLSPDYAQHSTLPIPPGREGFKRFFTAFHSAFADAHFTIEDLIAEDDRVSVRFTGRFTQKAEFMGIPATGKRLRLRGIDIFRISGAKIVEHWDEVDRLGLLQQFGVIPSLQLKAKAVWDKLWKRQRKEDNVTGVRQGLITKRRESDG